MRIKKRFKRGDLRGAFQIATDIGDDSNLIRLMGRSGVCFSDLIAVDSDVAISLLYRCVAMLEGTLFVEHTLLWLEAVAKGMYVY